MASTAVTLIGNLTRDPELTFTTTGRGKVEFSIACNDSWTDKDGQKQEKTAYYDIVGWGNLAEDITTVIQKGMAVIVVGRLEQQTWTDKETGKNRSKVAVLADKVAVNVQSITEVTRKNRSEGGAQQSENSRLRGKAVAAQQKTRVVEEEAEPF